MASESQIAEWQMEKNLYQKNDIKLAKEIACDQYDDFRFRVKNKLPLNTKRFSIVSDLAIKDMKKELDRGYGKKTYLHYIGAIERYLIPFFGNTHIDNIDYMKLKEFDDWRIEKVGLGPNFARLDGGTIKKEVQMRKYGTF